MTSLLYLTQINSVNKKEEKEDPKTTFKQHIKKPKNYTEHEDKQLTKPPPLKFEPELIKPLKKQINKYVPRNAKSVTYVRKKKENKINENNFFKDIGDHFTMENLGIKYNREIRKHKRDIDTYTNEFEKKKSYLKKLELKIEEVILG